MKYQIPQFISIEDKIFGPLTLKQFLYVAGASGISFIIWSILPGLIAVFIIIPIAGFLLALAFYKYNDRPLIYTVENGFNFLTKSKLYIWKKEPNKITSLKKAPTKETPQMNIPKLSENRLKKLSWSLDIKEGSDEQIINNT